MKEIILYVLIGWGEPAYYAIDADAYCDPFTGTVFVGGEEQRDMRACQYTDSYGNPVYDLSILDDHHPELMLDVYLIESEWQRQDESWLPL